MSTCLAFVYVPKVAPWWMPLGWLRVVAPGVRRGNGSESFRTGGISLLSATTMPSLKMFCGKRKSKHTVDQQGGVMRRADCVLRPKCLCEFCYAMDGEVGETRQHCGEGLRLGGGVGSLPTVGEQIIEFLMWMGAEAREQVADVGEGFDVLALAGC